MKESLQKNLVKAFGYALDSKLDKALNEYKKVVLEKNDLIEAYIALGTIFRKKGELLKSIHIFESVLSRNDISPDVISYVMHELVHDYRLSGQYDKALEYLNRLIAKDSSNTLLKLLADIQFEMKKLDEAIKSYSRYQKLTKKDMSNYIANCYIEKAEAVKEKNPNEYYKILKKALKLYPQNHRLNVKMAQYYIEKGKKSKAVDIVKNFVELGYVKSMDELNFIRSVYFDYISLDLYLKSILKKVAANDENPIFVLSAADYFFNKENNEDKAINMLKDYIENVKPYNIVIKKYAEISGESILNLLYKDKYNYKCSECGETFMEYYDICGNCKKPDTLEPIY